MARPKSSVPTKGKLNLSVTEQTRAELTFISQQTGVSISNLVAEWAKKEARKIAKTKGVQPPDANQMTIEDI